MLVIEASSIKKEIILEMVQNVFTLRQLLRWGGGVHPSLFREVQVSVDVFRSTFVRCTGASVLVSVYAQQEARMSAQLFSFHFPPI